MHYKVWDEVTYPFPNFNAVIVEVWNGKVIFYPLLFWTCDYLFMLDVFGADCIRELTFCIY